MNAIELLVQQHRKLESDLKALLEMAAEKRQAKFDKVADLLMAHVLVEEQYFYPAVKAKRTEDVLMESLEEHLSLKRLLADLVAMPSTDPHFEPKLQVLKEQAEHHHDEEEEKLFPPTRKILSAEELEALGATMDAAQKKLLTGHPRDLVRAQTDEAAELP